MTTRETTSKKPLEILKLDPWLAPFAGDLSARLAHYEAEKASLLGGQKLSDFANGYLYFGFHRTPEGWIYREWAPAAQALFLTGDFNGWNRTSHPMERLEHGVFEIRLDGRDALRHLQRVKVYVVGRDGRGQDRIPLYIRRVTQDSGTRTFAGQIWAPDVPFEWSDAGFSPAAVPPLIYEAHIGMAQEKEAIGTYKEFTNNILPRIQADGYNTVQLMAVLEHPYYASFGYHVSNFFAASSWFGTPDDFKELVDTAHAMGLRVLLDLVHSHAVKNVAEGINLFDGTETQFFLPGEAGNHPAWDSKVFDYGKHEVIHFLLSNVKFWMDEYHVDGYRFDGVTSMLYHNHGLNVDFTHYAQYFSPNTNRNAVVYLQLATDLAHEFNGDALLVAEEMSGMPGMCLPVEAGGVGFDFRLSMGVPDFWIKTLKELPDEQWNMARMWHELTTRRPGEKNIAYTESHDQALVGDKTIMFRLADQEMYWGMNRAHENVVVERAVALHKLIRFVTLTLGGEGYLNFMGNEFGHPEWVDFPREGNDWSFQYARRQWHLADDGFLRYQFLGDFDKAMLELVRDHGVLSSPFARNLWQHEDQKMLAFEKAGLLFLFNFHPSWSQPEFFLPTPQPGTYRVIFDSDDAAFGGYGRIAQDVSYEARIVEQVGQGFQIYSPARTVLVLQKQ